MLALEVGRLIREWRRHADLSQRELATRLGTTQSVVSRWENGHEEPRLSTVDRVARVCGLHLTLSVVEDVDRDQIRQQLRLSPEERLRSSINVARMLTMTKASG